MNLLELKGTKKVEIPYFLNQIEQGTGESILIVGEVVAADQISKSLISKKCSNVTTTDIRERPINGWLNTNTNWDHITQDFIEFDTNIKFDIIISVSIFEHFGLFWDKKSMFNNKDGIVDLVRWDHDIRGIEKSCMLLKDKNSKVIVTLPAGPYMNYNDEGYPILRYYNKQRQNIVKKSVDELGCRFTDEKFYYTENFENWSESDPEINEPRFYQLYNPYTPNVIWAFTIQKK